MTITEKFCKKCNKTLSIENFYRHKKMSDGYLNVCKICTINDVRNYRKENIEKIKKYDLQRAKLPDRKKLTLEKQRKRRSLNKHKGMAYWAVYSAIKSGRIARPDKCSICKNICFAVAHHEDYAKPLDVVWLCTSCHFDVHTEKRRFEP